GVEGKFYTFTLAELEAILDPEESTVFNSFYSVTPDGNWEEEHTNILKRSVDIHGLAEKLTMSADAAEALLAAARSKVFAYRSKRVRPGLDDKIIAGWNGMMLRGYVD